jgi:hypothetical protein
MKSLILLTNCDKVRAICEISLKDTNINLQIVKNVDHVKPSDMVIIDESFIGNDLDLLKAYVSKLNEHCDKIGVITSRQDFDKDFVSFVIHKPFLPNHLVQSIITQFNKIENFKVQITDKNYRKNIDTSANIHITNRKKTPVLHIDEINEIKKLLQNTAHKRAKRNNIRLNIDQINDYDDSKITKRNNSSFSRSNKTNNKARTTNNTITLDRFLLEQLMPLFAVLDKEVVTNLMRGKVVDLKLKLST